MPKTSYYTVNGQILGERTSGVRRNYGIDALGSVTSTIQGSAIENVYAYKPYGALLAKSGLAPDPNFRWIGTAGYKAPSLTKSGVYVRYRAYNPELGTWLTKDPAWPKTPAYGYVESNPTSWRDPSGLYKEGIRAPDYIDGCIRPLQNPAVTRGCTDCNVITGSMYTIVLEDTALRRCTVEATIEHERVHQRHGQSCCTLAKKRADALRPLIGDVAANLHAKAAFDETKAVLSHASECAAQRKELNVLFSMSVREGCTGALGAPCCFAFWRRMARLSSFLDQCDTVPILPTYVECHPLVPLREPGEAYWT